MGHDRGTVLAGSASSSEAPPGPAVMHHVTRPLLIAHGEDDCLVPARHAQRTDKPFIPFKPGEPGSITARTTGG